MDKTNRLSIMKKAFKATIPVLTGYLVLGFGFGMLLRVAGYGTFWAFIISFFVYSGALQYVAVDLISGGASFFLTGLTTLMVNARHLFYGISMIDKCKGFGPLKAYIAFCLTDETYALLSLDSKRSMEERRVYCVTVAFLDHCYWISGCVLGNIAGYVLHFNTAGLDFTLTALFITIFIDQWKSSKNHISAVIGIVISIICLIVFGPGNFLIPTMIVMLITLLASRNILEAYYDK